MNIILLGKTASGKTTIARKLCEEHGFQKIVTYTTRPIREKNGKPIEVEGVDYHFISKERFDEMVANGEFAETTSYKVKTEDGSTTTWYYGSTVESIMNGFAEDNKVIILNPAGYKAVKCQIAQFDYLSCYIYVDEKQLIQRLKQRGDTKKEYMRRLEADREDFLNITSNTDVFIPNDGTIENAMNSILVRLNDPLWLETIMRYHNE